MICYCSLVSLLGPLPSCWNVGIALGWTLPAARGERGAAHFAQRSTLLGLVALGQHLLFVLRLLLSNHVLFTVKESQDYFWYVCR